MFKYHQIISFMNSVSIYWELTNICTLSRICICLAGNNPIKPYRGHFGQNQRSFLWFCFVFKLPSFILALPPFCPQVFWVASNCYSLYSEKSSFLAHYKVRKSVMSQMCLPQKSLFRKSHSWKLLVESWVLG